jgi:hypothetical protein
MTSAAGAQHCQSIKVNTSTRLLTFPNLPDLEQILVTTSWKRLIAALAFVLPAAALVATPVMAKTKTHHTHKASHHTTKKPAPTTTQS